MSSTQFDELDRKILKLLINNARKPYLEIARECNVSGASIHQRIQKLTSLGLIEGFETQINPAALGYDTCAYVGFVLSDPLRTEEVVAALRNVPEIVEVHYTTGKYDLLAKLYAENNTHLLKVIRDRIFVLNAGRTETLISFKEEFSRQVPIDQMSVDQ
ncbi:MAG: AsnC family transcriptional regulator [Bacteroides sp.]|nr:AsnC family transcriptional regulator [Bacteroides sp.]